MRSTATTQTVNSKSVKEAGKVTMKSEFLGPGVQAVVISCPIACTDNVMYNETSSRKSEGKREEGRVKKLDRVLPRRKLGSGRWGEGVLGGV